MEGNLDAERAAVSETSPTRRHENDSTKEQRCDAGCDNSLENRKWPQDYLPTSSLPALGSVATHILAPQGAAATASLVMALKG